MPEMLLLVLYVTSTPRQLPTAKLNAFMYNVGYSDHLQFNNHREMHCFFT